MSCGGGSCCCCFVGVVCRCCFLLAFGLTAFSLPSSLYLLALLPPPPLSSFFLLLALLAPPPRFPLLSLSPTSREGQLQDKFRDDVCYMCCNARRSPSKVYGSVVVLSP